MKSVKKILVICRMVTHCDEIIHYGATLARQLRAEVIVMNVIHDPFGTKGWNLPLPSLAEDFRKLIEKTRKDMHEIVIQEKKQGISIQEIVLEGTPIDAILKVIKEQNIDLMVLPAHEETRLEHFLFGRENEEFMRRMPCSVLFVKIEPESATEEQWQDSEEQGQK